jgi:hypothetical protein
VTPPVWYGLVIASGLILLSVLVIYFWCTDEHEDWP